MRSRSLLLCFALTFTTACGSSRLEDLKGLNVSVVRGIYLADPKMLLVSLSYDKDEDDTGCFSGGGGIHATFNGRPIVVDQGGMADGWFDLGECEAPWMSIATLPEDETLPESVLEIFDSSRRIRVKLTELFAPEWKLVLQEPSDGVLRPGGEVVLSWQPSTYSLEFPTQCTSGVCGGPLAIFSYPNFTTTRMVSNDSMSVSGKTLRLRVPSNMETGPAYLSVSADGYLRSLVTECTGAENCYTTLRGPGTSSKINVTIAP
jgi:hypothetical protein